MNTEQSAALLWLMGALVLLLVLIVVELGAIRASIGRINTGATSMANIAQEISWVRRQMFPQPLVPGHTGPGAWSGQIDSVYRPGGGR
jgi:hypothetical protein